ncbi:hypothetical protein [Chamaesiphon sp. GL140_3_metabinner_50]|uniref:hypothetical protein n=1 Tax=Chamaesiphon sp. GL140_3_metabinner_50 TaxID=2970812 RepID=UPI0025E2BA8A|nr:hypothetical protein [Chamaesiphon sp. GL140_3_metabinner_50]
MTYKYRLDLMNSNSQPQPNNPPANTTNQIERDSEASKILCPHCLRTATNKIKCKGLCVADSDY